MSILISFIAKNNDKVIRGNNRDILSYGPTISFIKNYNQKNKESINKAYILYMESTDPKYSKDEPQVDIVKSVISEAKSIIPDVKFISMDWGCGKYISPIDHNGIFKALAGNLPKKENGLLRDIIKDNSDTEYIIHTSPGTPAMHSIWLLVTRYIQFNWNVSLYQSHKDTILPVDMDSSFYDQIKSVECSLSEINYFPRESKCLSSVQQNVDIYSKLHLSILILGERGSGKTTLAKELRSLRYPDKKNKPWPVVACGQFDENSMRSELFGHVKGAYTGADKPREGLLKQLDADLLFLDEVGDLSKETQRLLIRALDEKKFTPMGSDETISSNFTLIAATNKTITELRILMDQDFFDRISTVIINMPAIRNHREDIVYLFDQVLEKVKNSFTFKHGKKTISAQNKDKILEELSDKSKFRLDGNMRDIEFICKHYIAYLLSSNDEDAAIYFALEKLEEREQMLNSSSESVNRTDISRKENTLKIHIEDYLNDDFSLERFLTALKDELIKIAYEQCNENAKKTADFLGYKNHGSISRSIHKNI